MGYSLEMLRERRFGPFALSADAFFAGGLFFGFEACFFVVFFTVDALIAVLGFLDAEDVFAVLFFDPLLDAPTLFDDAALLDVFVPVLITVADEEEPDLFFAFFVDVFIS